MFNVSQLYCIPQFLTANFWEVNKQAFITIKEKKRNLRFYYHVFWRILSKKSKHPQRSWPMAYFRCNMTENFIFAPKYRQWRVDLNTTKKLLVFVTIYYNISSLRPAIIYENFIFTKKYAFAKRCYFLTFSFEKKLTKYDISVKQKHTKANENMIFSALFANFCKTEILFFMQCHCFYA